uniref:U3 snoRNA-associated protein 11 n=1 Tax=Chaetoceros debilis TaxID=122233 RepID=A0A7S3QAT0_9STRA
MSSLRNAVKRITHKERSQPQKRAHLGLLEKKKDYKKRSNDHHRKEDAITNLRRKASQRNPDEFYFAMNNAQMKDGKHRRLEEAERKARINEIGADAVKIMKSQDLSYVRMQSLKDQKKVERMQASLQYLGDNPATMDSDDDFDSSSTDPKRKRGKHTVFVNSKEKAENFDVAEHFGTIPQFAGRSFNRLRKETLLKIGNNDDGYYDDDEDDGFGKKKPPSEKRLKKEERMKKNHARALSKARSKAYAELEARTKRVQDMKNTEAHLVTENIVASKGRKRKIKGAEDGKPAVYVFRRKRAR